jgi:hypothetical protein
MTNGAPNWRFIPEFNFRQHANSNPAVIGLEILIKDFRAEPARPAVGMLSIGATGHNREGSKVTFCMDHSNAPS